MYLSIPEVGSYVIGTVAELNCEDFMHCSVWATSGSVVSLNRLGFEISPCEPCILS